MPTTFMTDSARSSVKHSGSMFVIHMPWARWLGRLASAAPDHYTSGPRSVGRSCWTEMNSCPAGRARDISSSLGYLTRTCHLYATWLAIAVVFRRQKYAVADDGPPESRRLKGV